MSSSGKMKITLRGPCGISSMGVPSPILTRKRVIGEAIKRDADGDVTYIPYAIETFLVEKSDPKCCIDAA